MNSHIPTRVLPHRPDLNQLKRQAKELLAAFTAGDRDALREVNALYQGASPGTFALHDAQLVLARAHGFESWTKLKAFVDGATLRRLVEAVRGGDVLEAQVILNARPDLARMSLDNLQVLHHAVLLRSPELVRLLMRHGANAHAGIYPHRDATSALEIAAQRGDTEIVGIIESEERSRVNQAGTAASHTAERLFSAIEAGDEAAAIALMERNTSLIHAREPLHESTPLHVAAKALRTRIAAWVLEHGAQAAARAWHGSTPLDFAARSSDQASGAEFGALAELLFAHGAPQTPAGAAALGDARWLGAQHAGGGLTNPIEDSGGLLTVAVRHDRAEILRLLLDFGWDPDERKAIETDGDNLVFTWGMPLWHCASSGKHEMAALLLSRGADPNAQVFASGTPLGQAYGRRDRRMIELLEQHGGLPNGTVAGLYRQAGLARRLLAGEAGTPAPDPMFAGQPLAEELLWAGACGGDPEIVRMALEQIDWPRDDPRWFHILEQPLRFWNHSDRHWSNPDWDRRDYLECFRLIVNCCDPNIRGRIRDRGEFGLTILHSVAGSRGHVQPQERVAFATVLLDAGASLDARDNVLRSTPLGWACRWGRIELVRLMLARGADPLELGAEPWARPEAWARRMGHRQIAELLLQHSPQRGPA